MRRDGRFFCDGEHRSWDEEDLEDRGDLREAVYFRECAYCGIEVNLCLACRDRIFLCPRCFLGQRRNGKDHERRCGRRRERDRERKRRARRYVEPAPLYERDLFEGA